jgi:IclR family transcriptional regulator, pca regulon regulatory protein
METRKAPDPRYPGRYSRSLERGLSLLGCFSGTCSVMTLNEIAQAVQLTHTTTHRYATTLAALGYLEQDSKCRYRLGVRVNDVGLAALAATGFREQAHPLLEQLRQRTGCTIAVGMLDAVEVVCVDRTRSQWREQTGVEQCLRPGSRLPAHCTAMGEILLAHLPEKERDRRIAQMTLSEHGPNTITSPSARGQELSRVLANGIALNDRELGPEIYGIAAPVRERTGAVTAAIGVVADTSTTRTQSFVTAVRPRLVTVASQLSVLHVDRFHRQGS